jgi:hypothetical protein
MSSVTWSSFEAVWPRGGVSSLVKLGEGYDSRLACLSPDSACHWAGLFSFLSHGHLVARGFPSLFPSEA